MTVSAETQASAGCVNEFYAEQIPVFNNNSSNDFLIWLYQNIKYPESADPKRLTGFNPAQIIQQHIMRN
jgi:hypothetical protein